MVVLPSRRFGFDALGTELNGKRIT